MPDNPRTGTGMRLRALRMTLGLTLEQLARATGTTKARISQVENDQGFFRAALALKVAQFFAVPLEYLLGTTDDDGWARIGG